MFSRIQGKIAEGRHQGEETPADLLKGSKQTNHPRPGHIFLVKEKRKSSALRVSSVLFFGC
jgi:hypothetical protein